MKTASKLGCLALAGLTLLSGCVPSLNPVYTDADLIFESGALGTWIQPNTPARWEFTKHGEKAYRVVYTDKEGRQGRFIAHLAKIKGARFLDLYPEDLGVQSPGFHKIHLVPIHTIYLVRRTEPTLELAAIDFGWLQKYLTDHPDAVPNASYGGGKLLTAPTEEVQAFLVAHQEAFTNDFKLERQANAK